MDLFWEVKHETFIDCRADDLRRRHVRTSCGLRQGHHCRYELELGHIAQHIERFILEHAYGCDAELVPADPMPTGAAMVEQGSPDIAPEVWAGSMGDALDKGVAAGQLVIAGHSLADGGEEGFWVPAYMVEKDASLATIEGIRKKASLFASADHPGKSVFYGCPAGWSCQISTGNLFEALKLSDAGFEMVEPGSAAGLADSLARAYEGKQPWFGYYWSPTAILGKYRMKKVDFGTGIDETHYRDCITHKECMDPQATMFPSTAIQAVATSAICQDPSRDHGISWQAFLAQ